MFKKKINTGQSRRRREWTTCKRSEARSLLKLNMMKQYTSLDKKLKRTLLC